MDEKSSISDQISQNFIPINKSPALIQIMARYLTGETIIWTNDSLVYWCIYHWANARKMFPQCISNRVVFFALTHQHMSPSLDELI